MPIYERVNDGEVVERVNVVDGTFEDTRIGLAVLEERDGWRKADVSE